MLIRVLFNLILKKYRFNIKNVALHKLNNLSSLILS